MAFCRKLPRVRDADLIEISPLRHPGEWGLFGRAAREHVGKRFLTPSLVRDELEQIKEIVGGGE